MWDICIFCLHCKLRSFPLFGLLVSGIFFYVESVKTDIMNSSKRQTTPLSISSVSPQSLFDGVRLRLENFSRIQWAIFVASPSGGLEPCVSLVGGMTQVTAALMR